MLVDLVNSMSEAMMAATIGGAMIATVLFCAWVGDKNAARQRRRERDE